MPINLMRFRVFNELQGTNTQEKSLRLSAGRGIALLIFIINVSKFSRELRLGFKDNCIDENENLNFFSGRAFSFKRDL